MPFLKRGATDAKNVMVGRGSSAVQAKRVMVGTGTTAVEVWPGVYDVSMDFGFANTDNLKWAPITGFDSRTDSSSPLSPGFVFSDMFVAGDNTDPTYHTRLVDHEIDQLPLKFVVTLGDVLNDVTRPSWVVLAANLTMTHMLIAEFGSNGFRVFALINGVKNPTTPYQYNQSLLPGDIIEITLDSGFVSVGKLNGGATNFSAPSMINSVRSGPGRMYFGFGVFSTASQWSSRIQRIQITGKTTQKRVLAASETLPRITIPSGTWTEVARSVIPTGGVTSVFLVGASWPQQSSSQDRFFRLKVDGVIKGTTADEGTSLSFNSITLLDNSVVTVEAYAETTNSSYRKISGGILQIGDPSLPT